MAALAITLEPDHNDVLSAPFETVNAAVTTACGLTDKTRGYIEYR